VRLETPDNAEHSANQEFYRMPRHANLIPSYRRHKKTGRAVITVRDHLGGRRDILLPGEYRSKESTAEYDRICSVLRANSGRLPETKGNTVDLTVTELVLRYMDHASTYYVDPITKEPTSELACLTLAFAPLNRLFGEVSVVEFDSLKLEALQQSMATGTWLTEKELAAAPPATHDGAHHDQPPHRSHQATLPMGMQQEAAGGREPLQPRRGAEPEARADDRDATGVGPTQVRSAVSGECRWALACFAAR
jgi:hypothetical protein